MRSCLREGHRKCHSVLDLRPHRRVSCRAHSGCRRLHHAAERIFQDGIEHRQAVWRRLHLDEVQTAWGRTGHKWFGIEHWEVEPDIITAAKGMGNGVPVGLTVAKPRLRTRSKD